MLFEKANKVGRIFIAKLPGNLIHLVSGGQQISFRFKNNIFVNNFRWRFAQNILGDCA